MAIKVFIDNFISFAKDYECTDEDQIYEIVPEYVERNVRTTDDCIYVLQYCNAFYNWDEYDEFRERAPRDIRSVAWFVLYNHIIGQVHRYSDDIIVEEDDEYDEDEDEYEDEDYNY